MTVLERPVAAALALAACLLVVPGRAPRAGPSTGIHELAALRGMKSDKTFPRIARKAGQEGRPVRALRWTLDGQLPTLYTFLAFARGASAGEEEAERIWAAAERAAAPRPAPARAGPDQLRHDPASPVTSTNPSTRTTHYKENPTPITTSRDDH
ncbi:hypothetical protein SHKM778_96150 (plasmid) [Streptomyces sp. KM77-8]|uniref:Uncharacterized protein n=1 Tax=Streptomyces haneummycinicus TaxID=3074435 RepID=A0AAT9HLN4_9ACTN